MSDGQLYHKRDRELYRLIRQDDDVVTFSLDGSKSYRYLGKDEFEKRFAPATVRIGDLTMEKIFKPNGIENLSDLQALMDAVEVALGAAPPPSAKIPVKGPPIPEDIRERIDWLGAVYLHQRGQDWKGKVTKTIRFDVTYEIDTFYLDVIAKGMVMNEVADV
jgi:hypothetical protein